MTNEASKTRDLFGSLERRVLRGSGIDIGCGEDPIFPDVRRFDMQDGDADHITDHVKEQFDFVFSSHCLEHMRDPATALKGWWSLVKDGGHMCIIVPDEDLYEHGNWPSKFNSDHKWTFTISKEKSWSPVSINVIDLVRGLPDCRVLKVALQDDGYDYTAGGAGGDQLWGQAVAQIQFVLRKLTADYLPAQYALAEQELGQGNFYAALKATENALAVAPRESALYDLLLKIEMARGDKRRAAQYALQGVKVCIGARGLGRWHRLAAMYMIQMGNRDSAAQILGLGLAEFPDDPELKRLKEHI